MSAKARPQTIPGPNYITQSSGNYLLPANASDDTGLIDIIDLRNLTRDRNQVTSVIFNDVGDAFASVDTTGHIAVFYIAKDKFINVCRSVHPTAMFLTELNNGMMFLGIEDNTIQVYNLGGKLLKQLRGHKHQVRSFQINYTRNLLLSESQDACILWDLSTLKMFKILHSKHTGFSCAIFSPSENSLITCFQDSSLYFWNLDTLQLERRIMLPSTSRLTKMIVSFEGNTLMVAGESPLVYIFHFEADDNYQSYELPTDCDSILDIVFLPEERILLLGNNGMLYCIDPSQNSRILFVKGLPGQRTIRSFTVNKRGKFLLTVSDAGEIYFYDFQKLLNLTEKSNKKRIDRGNSPDFVYQSLKPSNSSGLYQQSFTSKTNAAKTSQDKPPSSSSDTKYQMNDHARSSNQGFHSPNFYPAQDQEDSNKRNNERQGRDEDHRRPPPDHEEVVETPDRVSFFQTSDAKNIRPDSLDSLEEAPHSLLPIQSPQSLSISLQQLSKPYLVTFLSKFGIFPGKQRGAIWKFLLDLPLNSKAFGELQVKGPHPAFSDFFNQYPRSKLSERVQGMLSCLAHYCEIFSQVEYLPGLIFPFVRIFGEQEVLCFEIILSFLLNWGQHFFQNHPKQPVFLLQALEKLLEYHEPHLSEHLKHVLSGAEGVGIGDILWTFAQNMLTDILKREDWLALLDFFILHRSQPNFLIHFLVAYFSFLKEKLLKEHDKDALADVGYFVDWKSEVDIFRIIETMVSQIENTPVSAVLISFKDNLPLPKGRYPSPDIFTPQLRDYYQQMDEYLSIAEKKRAERRDELKDVYKKLEEVSYLGQTFKAKQEDMAEKRNEVRHEIAKEEMKRLAQKADLEQEGWRRRMDQLKTMEDEMRSCLERQERMREQIRVEMEKEVHLKEKIEQEKLRLKMEEEGLLRKELETLQKGNEVLNVVYEEERERGDRLDVEKRQQEEIARDVKLREKLLQEEEEFQMRMDITRGTRAQEERILKETEQVRGKRFEKGIEEFDREIKRNDIEREAQVRRLKEVTTADEFDALQDILGGTKNIDETDRSYRTETFADPSHLENKERKSGEEYVDSVREQESVQRSDKVGSTRERLNQEREEMLRKRRERMKALDEERNVLQRELEESRTRLKQLNVDRKTREDVKQSTEFSREQESGTFEKRSQGNRTFQGDEESYNKDLREDYLGKEKIEQDKKDFERTLKETQKRIFEEDQLKYEQFREVLRREMNSIDEGSGRTGGERGDRGEGFSSRHDREKGVYDEEEKGSRLTAGRRESQENQYSSQREQQEGRLSTQQSGNNRLSDKGERYTSGGERASHTYSDRNRSRDVINQSYTNLSNDGISGNKSNNSKYQYQRESVGGHEKTGSYGERRSQDERGSYGERRSQGERGSQGERKSHVERRSVNEEY